MALADPQTVTINSVPKTCNRISSTGTKTVYQTSDEEVKLTISHQSGKGRTRRMARCDQLVIAADPLTAENEYKSLGVYLVVDQPDFGFTDAEIDYVVQALNTWLSTATVTKLLGSQH